MKLYLTASIALILSSVNSQVVFHEPILRDAAHDGYFASDMLSIPAFTLSANNAELLASVQQAESAPVHSGPFKFGKDFDVDLSIADGKWSSTASGVSIWRFRIESPSAHSLNLVFKEFDIPAGAEFYIRSLSTGETVGPFTQSNVREDKKFAVAPLRGDAIVLEYYTKSSAQLPSIRISKIIHGFRPMEAFRGSGECNINVACAIDSPWNPQIRSVAMILEEDGTGFCSGAMINNGKRDGRQLYLTAFHCVGRADVTNNILMFNYQASKCDGTDRSAPRMMTAHGMKKVSQWSQSDFALLELLEPIPEEYNVHLSGWSSADEESVPFNPVGIHHPSADIKKISYTDTEAVGSCWGWCDSSDPLDHWKIPRWHKGTTEPGSSGSPLFDSKTHRIVGQLHGGSASCSHRSGYDVYGKLSYSFNKSSEPTQQLVHALDPESKGLLAMDGDDLNKLRNSTMPPAIFYQQM